MSCAVCWDSSPFEQFLPNHSLLQLFSHLASFYYKILRSKSGTEPLEIIWANQAPYVCKPREGGTLWLVPEPGLESQSSNFWRHTFSSFSRQTEFLQGLAS